MGHTNIVYAFVSHNDVGTEANGKNIAALYSVSLHAPDVIFVNAVLEKISHIDGNQNKFHIKIRFLGCTSCQNF